MFENNLYLISVKFLGCSTVVMFLNKNCRDKPGNYVYSLQHCDDSYLNWIMTDVFVTKKTTMASMII